MFVNVRAVQRENFQGVWTEHRFWPSGEALRVEVLDTDEDAPKITQPILEHGTGRQIGEREVADMTKIGRKTFADLKADGRLTILADGEIDATISKAMITAAQKAAAESSARVVELEGENAALKAQLETVGAELAEAHRSQATPGPVSDYGSAGSAKTHAKGK